MWTYVDLFSGIGMFSLACEKLGGECVAFAEKEPFCQDILRTRFPNVPIFEDVVDVTSMSIAALTGGRGVDAVVGGFPCQDISGAGPGGGIDKGARSGLWSEMYRVICELQPKMVVIENVALPRKCNQEFKIERAG